MATVTAIDYRRTDQRVGGPFEVPYWITSGLVVADDADDLAAILFSFPKASEAIVIHEICIQIVTAITGGVPSGTLGMGSLATDAVTTGGVVTTVDVDDFMVTGDVTWGTAGYYWPTSGSDFLTAKAAGSISGPAVQTGAATTVPCVVLYLDSTTTLAAGNCRVHALISRIPGI
jgi:hypothetical protein